MAWRFFYSLLGILLFEILKEVTGFWSTHAFAFFTGYGGVYAGALLFVAVKLLSRKFFGSQWSFVDGVLIELSLEKIEDVAVTFSVVAAVYSLVALLYRENFAFAVIFVSMSFSLVCCILAKGLRYHAVEDDSKEIALCL